MIPCRCVATLVNVLQFPVLRPNTVGSDLAYWLSPDFYPETSHITTQWLQVPTGNTSTNDSSSIDFYPSAFLVIQVPYANSSVGGVALTCSVDARWVNGTNVATSVHDPDGDFLQHAELGPQNFPTTTLRIFQRPDNLNPTDKRSWKQVELDLSWLDVLTPSIPIDQNSTKYELNQTISNASSGWTTLASTLQAAGFDNSTGLIFNYTDIVDFTNVVVSMLVAEGISRVGFTNNGGIVTNESDAAHQIRWLDNLNDVYTNLVSDGTAINPPQGYLPEELTELHWTITVVGYSYSANSTTYYLALTVLGVYLLLALGHIC